jgi:CRP-like cAMP-binding protein
MQHIDIQILKSIELFKDLDGGELGQLASILNPVRVTEGETLMRRGEPAQTFYVVLSGNYMVYFKGGQAFTLHKLGDVIGWSTVVTPFYYRATGIALTNGDLLSMSRLEFLRLVQKNAVLSGKIMKKINEVVEKRLYFLKTVSGNTV